MVAMMDWYDESGAFVCVHSSFHQTNKVEKFTRVVQAIRLDSCPTIRIAAVWNNGHRKDSKLVNC